MLSGKPLYCDGYHPSCRGWAPKIYNGEIFDRYFLSKEGKQLQMDLNAEKSQMEFTEKVRV